MTLSPPATLNNQQMALWETISTKLVTLDDRVWEGRASGPSIENWLNNFTGRTGADVELERLHALYLLSQFMYYGQKEIRILLQAMYRELFLLPLVQQIKDEGVRSVDFSDRLAHELQRTRFLGVGNPSESGVHLLYFFRQENGLSKSNFLDAAQIYRQDTEAHGRARVPRYPEVKRYIFLDDLCGSGETAWRYSQDLLPDLLLAAPSTEVHYLALFASSEGLKRVRENTTFGHRCGAVHELDNTYKWSHRQSRYLASLPSEIYRSLLISIAFKYGEEIWREYPLGFDHGELLLGFSHNTPDNTLPIIWGEEANGSDATWCPIFKRYPKV